MTSKSSLPMENNSSYEGGQLSDINWYQKMKLVTNSLRKTFNHPSLVKRMYSLVKPMFWSNIKAGESNQPIFIVSRQTLTEILRTILQNCFLLDSYSSIQKVTDTQQVVKHSQFKPNIVISDLE